MDILTAAQQQINDAANQMNPTVPAGGDPPPPPAPMSEPTNPVSPPPPPMPMPEPPKDVPAPAPSELHTTTFGGMSSPSDPPMVTTPAPADEPPKKKKGVGKGVILAGLLLLLVTLPVAVYYISQQQQQLAEIRSRAAAPAGNNCCGDSTYNNGKGGMCSVTAEWEAGYYACSSHQCQSCQGSSQCGNGQCEPGEDHNTCPSDCTTGGTNPTPTPTSGGTGGTGGGLLGEGQKCGEGSNIFGNCAAGLSCSSYKYTDANNFVCFTTTGTTAAKAINSVSSPGEYCRTVAHLIAICVKPAGGTSNVGGNSCAGNCCNANAAGGYSVRQCTCSGLLSNGRCTSSNGTCRDAGASACIPDNFCGSMQLDIIYQNQEAGIAIARNGNGVCTTPPAITPTAPPPGPTPTPTPPPAGQCVRIKVYKGTVAVNPTTLKAGDAVTLAVAGTNATRGRIRVNGAAFVETTTKNASGEFTVPFTIPAGVTSFTIEAEVFTNGQWK